MKRFLDLFKDLFLFGLKVLATAGQFLVLEVHVPHVMVGGIMTDVEQRIHEQQLLQLVLHAKDTADDHRALGIDVGGTFEHLWKTLEHSTGYLSMLQAT